MTVIRIDISIGRSVECDNVVTTRPCVPPPDILPPVEAAVVLRLIIK